MSRYVTEFVGTFLLVLTIGLVVLDGTPMAPIAIGSVLMAMVYMGGHISGAHYNPAVSVAILIRGKMKARELAPYVTAQISGAILASLAVMLIVGDTFAPAPDPEAGLVVVLLCEGLFTFALSLVVLNVATDDATVGNSYYGLAIGFTVLAGAFAGTSAKSHGIVCPGLLGARSDHGYSYDPAKARELMAESGVTGLELTLRTLNWQERLLTAQIIQANLAAIGITVNILPMESGPFWEMGMEEAGDTWQDLELWIMRFATVPDPYEATQWFVSEQVGVWNWERWTSEEFDSLYDQGLSETDTAKREEIYFRMQEIMDETGAYVWINHEPETYAHKQSVEVVAAPSGELNYHRFKPV